MGNPEDKQKHSRRRKNHVLRDLHKYYKQKDHSPDEVYERTKYKVILEKELEDE